MLPRTGSSLLCRAIAHRICLDVLRLHFRRAGELPPHCYFQCWCQMLRCSLCCCSCMCLLLQPSPLGMKSWAGRFMAEPECANAWLVLGEAEALMMMMMMWATESPHSWLPCAFPGCSRWVPVLLALLPAGIEGPGKHLSLKPLKGARKKELQDVWLVEHLIIWEHQGRLPGSLLIRWNTLNCVKNEASKNIWIWIMAQTLAPYWPCVNHVISPKKHKGPCPLNLWFLAHPSSGFPVQLLEAFLVCCQVGKLTALSSPCRAMGEESFIHL